MISKNKAIFIYFIILLFICGLLADKYGWLERINLQLILEQVLEKGKALALQVPEMNLDRETLVWPFRGDLRSWFKIDAATGKYLLGVGLPVSVQPAGSSIFYTLSTHPFQLVVEVFEGVFHLGMRPTNVYLGSDMPVISYISPEVVVSRGEWDFGGVEVVVTEPTENYPPELEYDTGIKKVAQRNPDQGKIEVDYHLKDSTIGEKVVNSSDGKRLPGDQRSDDDRANPQKPLRQIPPSNREPRVLIYHTHTSETYHDDPRPMDANGHIIPPGSGRGQIVEVGRHLAEELHKRGIPVAHVDKIFDEVHREAYMKSRIFVKDFLNEHDRIEMVFDLHRDAWDRPSKEQLTTEIGGRKAARIMILVTQGSFGLPHPNWEQNLYFAQRLVREVQKKYPGLLRRLEVRREMRYNQDLHPHALLLEFGGFQSNFEECIYSAELLSNVLADMLRE